MEEIKGYIQSLLYNNSENGYTVARLKIDDGEDNKIVIVGYFKTPQHYELYRYYGEYKNHPRYGQQFEVVKYERINPTDKEAIIRFLSSSQFPGIGKIAAEEVYNCFGEESLNLIQQDATLLDTTSLNEKQKKAIIEGLQSTTYLEEAVKMFVQHGLTLRELMKMEAVYKGEMIQKVLSDPYALIDDIDGIDFKAADKLALSLGLSPTCKERIEAAIKTATYSTCQSKGDTYTNKRSIYYYFNRLIGDIDISYFESGFDALVDKCMLIVADNKIYPAAYYNAEVGICEMIMPFVQRQFDDYSEATFIEQLQKVEETYQISYSEDQKKAISSVFKKGINIITGGPGTGKTTIIKAICQLYYRNSSEKQIILCAPTGRASKRLSEVTGMQATTIHRLLGWDLHTNKFQHDEFNPVSGHFLIIDEFSMVDTELFYNLMRACQGFDRILIVGDDEQLPSVMPGDLLRDLKEIKRINIYNLSDIFRQAADSSIINVAYKVRGKTIDYSDFDNKDVYFDQLNDADAKTKVLKLILEYKQQGYNDLDIQVIAPMYLGVCGIDNLNAHLREIFNPQDGTLKELKIINRLYREKDKIIQLKNQPLDDVYNGDIGIIKEIIKKENSLEKKDLIIAEFEDNIVVYDINTFKNITHAYAISVHKAQGSEYPIVIMPITSEHEIMLKRKLIYTGITRAKKILNVIGSFSLFEEGIARKEQKPRMTSIVDRLNNRLL